MKPCILPKPCRGSAYAFREIGRRHGEFRHVAFRLLLPPTRDCGSALPGVDDRPRVFALPVARERPSSNDALNDIAWSLKPGKTFTPSARYRRELVRQLGRETLKEAADAAAWNAPRACGPISRWNGRKVRAEAENRIVLSDLLRHEIGLTAPCRLPDTRVCGACTVQIDGKPASRPALTLAQQCGAASDGADRGSAGFPIRPSSPRFRRPFSPPFHGPQWRLLLHARHP